MKTETKKEIIRILKFIGFSATAGIIEMGSFALLTELTEMDYWPCYLIALILSVTWNFTLNRKFTFRSANNIPKAMLLVALFYCVFIPVSTIGGNILAEDLMWNDYLVALCTMALNISTEFLYDRFVVFRKSIDTNLKKKES